MNMQLVLDADGAVLGRICSYAAKQALLGKTISILNAEKALITGNRRKTINDYQYKRSLGGSAQKGPNFPKKVERIMKRTIRGMLAYKQGRGADALDKIKCYVGVPKAFEGVTATKMTKQVRARAITLGEVAGELG
ncbi:MAG TPA: 50S ribosomal protein L13 [Candidatus Nanoarchaeia archaeon]|nr:50S ribosomal protein L13 [Candidatus Nanoarchaeia archaeon]